MTVKHECAIRYWKRLDLIHPIYSIDKALCWAKLKPNLLLAVQIREEIPAKASRRIIEPDLFIDPIEFLKVGLFQLEIALEVTLYPRRRLRFWQDRMSALDAPGQRDLGAVLAVFLPDFVDDRVVDEFSHVLAGAVDFVLIAKGRVLLDVDPFFLVIGCEGVLLQPGVQFDLMCSGHDGRFFEQAIEFCFTEVGDTDRFRLAGCEGFLHGFPCVDVVGVAGLDLSIFFWGQGIATYEWRRPVHEVEV